VDKNDLSEFRNAVYQKVRYRPDAILDLIDALTIAGQVSSPVAVSESPLFRRKFSSVYDVMLEGEIEVEQLCDLLVACQPAESETIADYEVYAVDATPNERMAAETLPDWGALKAQQNETVRYGHKYSWLVRLVQSGTSWVAPTDVQRIRTKSTDTKLAAGMAILARSLGNAPKKPIWVQEFGVCAEEMPEADIPIWLEKTVTAALGQGVSWFTWWASHDVDRRFQFHPFEYGLGLLTTDNRLKPQGRLFKQIAEAYRGKPVVFPTTHLPPPPQERGDAATWRWPLDWMESND
jgi:hypothetical protein